MGHMADEMNLKCVFYILICDPRKGLVLKREVQKKLCERLMPVVGVSGCEIVAGANIRDAACLRQEIQALGPVPAEIVLVEPGKDSVSLFSCQERDMFVERLKTYEGDTVELAVAISEETADDTCCVDI